MLHIVHNVLSMQTSVVVLKSYIFKIKEKQIETYYEFNEING